MKNFQKSRVTIWFLQKSTLKMHAGVPLIGVLHRSYLVHLFEKFKNCKIVCKAFLDWSLEGMTDKHRIYLPRLIQFCY
jgi:hypothetical protein